MDMILRRKGASLHPVHGRGRHNVRPGLASQTQNACSIGKKVSLRTSHQQPGVQIKLEGSKRRPTVPTCAAPWPAW